MEAGALSFSSYANRIRLRIPCTQYNCMPHIPLTTVPSTLQITRVWFVAWATGKFGGNRIVFASFVGLYANTSSTKWQ